MKKLLSSIILSTMVGIVSLFGGENTGSGNLLLNPDFRENFKHWTLRGNKNAFSQADGIVTVSPGEKGIFLVQYKLPIQAASYQMDYEIRGTGDKLAYKAYCEWNGSSDGKRFYRAAGAKNLSISDTWKKRTSRFQIPAEDIPKTHSFALVFFFKGPGTFQLKNISLIRIKDASSGQKILGGICNLKNAGEFLPGEKNEFCIYGKKNILPEIVKIPLKAGKRYKLSFEARGVATDDLTGFCAYRLIPAFEGNIKVEQDWDDVPNGGIQQKSITFTCPENRNSLNLLFEVKARHAVSFARFRLEELRKEQKQAEFILENPCYRNSIYHSMPIREISGTLTFPEKAVSAAISLLKGNKTLAENSIVPGERFRFPAESLEQGEYILRAIFLDMKRQPLRKMEDKIRKLPPAPMEVVMGQDLNFYINGKRFFPVSTWKIITENEKNGFYFAARNGINLYIRSVKTESELMDVLNRAGKYGIKVVVPMQHLQNILLQDPDTFGKHIRKLCTERVRNHPAFFGYFLIDEPAWQGFSAKRLCNAYEVLREFDPYHPVWINEAPRNGIAVHTAIAKAADIYGIDIYPYPYPNSHSGLKDKGLTSVGKYTELCFSAVAGKKPVWMALQGFSWKTLSQPDMGLGYPGYSHLRFMVYDTMLSHGNMVGFWGTQHIKVPPFYDNLLRITRELSRMSGFFSQIEKQSSCQTENPAVKADLLKVAGKDYLIVRNLTQWTQITTISGSFAAMRAQDHETDRKIVPGSFLSLEPFEVKIFGTAEIPPPLNTLPEKDPALEHMGNPYHQLLASEKKKTYYNGKAKWIWERDAVLPFAEAELTRKFQVRAKVRKAILSVSADDYATVFLNGKKITDFEAGWSVMERIDLTENLTQGENTLLVKAKDSGLMPCGVLVEMSLEYADGSSETILSDAQWTGKNTAAQVIAPYGKGAWGTRVSIGDFK